MLKFCKLKILKFPFLSLSFNVLNRIKNYFSFTRKEFNGIFVMFILLILLMLVKVFHPYFIPVRKVDFSEIQQEIASLKAMDDSAAKSFAGKYDYPKNNEPFKAASKLSLFDPNNLPETFWAELGLSEKQIAGIKKYESKGGKFYTKADVKKMYTISEQKFEELEPYIDLPDKKYASYDKKEYAGKNKYDPNKYANQSDYPKYTSTKNTKKGTVEINAADSMQLLTINGIGPSFASRIIKYRNRLGGFYSVNQLREVFGIDSAKFESLIPFVSVDPAKINQLPINSANFEELKKHPYLKFNIINALLNYRKQHGAYKSKAEIKNVAIVTEDLYRKIEPYIIVE